MPARVYLETSVISYLAARPSRDIVVAGHQRTTQQWWQQRHRFEPVISQLVIDEARAGDPELGPKRVALLKGFPLLDPTETSYGVKTRLDSPHRGATVRRGALLRAAASMRMVRL